MRAWLLVPFLAGCSILVEPPDGDRIACTGDGLLDPCPAGQLCRDGFCTNSDCEVRGQDACRPTNGIDDDCDGMIDEGFDESLAEPRCDMIDNDCDGDIDDFGGIENTDGTDTQCDAEDNDCDGRIDEDYDEDGDGFTRCGTFCDEDPDGGCRLDSGMRDCDDTDETTNPDAVEQCDAKDHDCNGQSLGDASFVQMLDMTCPSDEICEPSIPSCVPNNCRDAVSRRPCINPEVCDTAAVPPMCVVAGCTPTECSAGGQWCNPMTDSCEARLRNGAACGADEQCQNLRCSDVGAFRLPGNATGRVCSQACCSDADCPADEFCWDAGTGARTCLPPDVGSAVTGRTTLGSGGALDTCSLGSDCRSGACAADGRCLGTCRDSSQCPGTSVCSVEVGGLRMQCRNGLRDYGESCSSDAECAIQIAGGCSGDCLSQYCSSDANCPGIMFEGIAISGVPFCIYFELTDGGENATLARCSSGSQPGDPCCIDSQCADGDICRPQNVGGSWRMLCVPPPVIP